MLKFRLLGPGPCRTALLGALIVLSTACSAPTSTAPAPAPTTAPATKPTAVPAATTAPAATAAPATNPTVVPAPTTAAAAVPAPTTAAAAAGGQPLAVCVSFDKMNAFREGQQKFFEKAAAQLNIKMNLVVAGENAQQQSSQIDTCIAQKVAGIVDIPWDIESVLSDVQRTKDAKIPFVTVDQAPSSLETVDFHIGADPLADGTNAGKRLVTLVGDKPCKVVVLQGALDQFNGQMRDKGFKDAIKSHSNISIVSEVPTNWQPEPALAGMENALQANSDLCAVFAPTDGHLPPVFSALQKVGRYKKVGEEGHVFVLSIDGDPQGCAGVRDGWVDAGYAQPVPQMSHDSLQAIVDIHNGKPPAADKRIQFIAGTEYTQQNFEQTKAQVWGCQ